MFTDPEVWGAAALSLKLAALAVLLAAIPGVPLAALLAMSTRRSARVGLVLARAAVACPTVIVGLLVYSMLSRRGPAGGLDLLYTPSAIVVGEFLLALPLIVALGAASVQGLDRRFAQTVATLRLRPLPGALVGVSDARSGFAAALFVSFARCLGELGVALLVGGNLRGGTRTLPTAIALQTSRGEFERAVALGAVLLLLALGVHAAGAVLFRAADRR